MNDITLPYSFYPLGSNSTCPFCGKDHFAFSPISLCEAQGGRKHILLVISPNGCSARLNYDLIERKGHVVFLSPQITKETLQEYVKDVRQN